MSAGVRCEVSGSSGVEVSVSAGVQCEVSGFAGVRVLGSAGVWGSSGWECVAGPSGGRLGQ